jgi:hypothetical protein
MSTFSEKQMLEAFDRATGGARHQPELAEQALSVLSVWKTAWTQARATVDKEQVLLEKIFQHAYGISLGLDWNNGKAANAHRDKLIAAAKELAALRGEDEV